jgi:hypothetical protein
MNHQRKNEMDVCAQEKWKDKKSVNYLLQILYILDRKFRLLIISYRLIKGVFLKKCEAYVNDNSQ